MKEPFPWFDSKAVNHLLARDYPEPIYESKHSTGKEWNLISSVEIFNYTYPLRDKLYKLPFIVDLNDVLRKKTIATDELLKDIEILSDIILSAPCLDHSITVWRGISVRLDCKPGDILTNLGFMYCSLNRAIADSYRHDTSSCYNRTTQRIDIRLTKKLKVKGSLLKIIVPPGTRMIDESYLDICCPTDIVSELVFHHSESLQVMEVRKDYVTCELMRN